MNETSVNSTTKNQAYRIAIDLLEQFQKNDYKGYDPFDALNSRFFNNLPISGNKIFRLIWLQLHKRSPVNLRRLVHVDASRNPKSLALIIMGLLSLYRTSSDNKFLLEAKNIGHILLTTANRDTQSQHASWGYNFDWQARAFFVPRGKANAITTCYIISALCELHESTGEELFLLTAIDAARFLTDVHYIETDNRKFFAYIPGHKTFVHNASLWCAAKIARFLDTDLLPDHASKRVINAIKQSLIEQRKNGSWVYGGNSHHQFIDSFHTGYNLEALSEIAQFLEVPHLNSSIELGLDYFKKNFVLHDGRIKYYNNTIFPLDTHCYSQAILTLLKVTPTDASFLISDKVVNSMIEEMFIKQLCRFRYQRWRFMKNNVNYLRWTQAWAFYSLAKYREIR